MDELAADPASQTWQLTIPLRKWQENALSSWLAANGRGVIEAATGTGKTAVAMAAISWMRRVYGDRARVAIVVPRIALARQWRRELGEKLGMQSHDIGEIHSQPDREWFSTMPVLVSVINSARGGLSAAIATWRQRADVTVLLIVDECHHAGALTNSTVLESGSDYSMGLSATPDRDDDGHLWVYKGLGSPCYSYSLLDALDDGTLAPLQSVNLYIDFTDEEQAIWDGLTADISRLFGQLRVDHPELAGAGRNRISSLTKLADRGDPAASALLAKLTNRRQLLSDAKGRGEATDAIVSWLARAPRRVLLFHETKEMAERTYRSLLRAGIGARLEHSGLEPAARQSALRAFDSGEVAALSVVRAVDEGIDVADADCAVFVCGSRSKRQRIQRLGRVLRQTNDEKVATAITVLITGTPEEAGVGLRDAALLGTARVTHHRWPDCDIDTALTTLASTYAPRQQQWTDADRLSGPDLGLAQPPSATRTPKPRVPKPTDVTVEDVRQLAEDLINNTIVPSRDALARRLGITELQLREVLRNGPRVSAWITEMIAVVKRERLARARAEWRERNY